MSEELRERTAEVHAHQLRLAGVDERTAALEKEADGLRARLRSVEAARDQAWAREKLLEEQRATAVRHASFASS